MHIVAGTKRGLRHEELRSLRDRIIKERSLNKPSIVVSSGTCCQARGSSEIVEEFRKSIERHFLQEKVSLRITGCGGFCQSEPNVVIYPEEIYYQKLSPEDVEEIILKTILEGKIIERLLFIDPTTGQKTIHLKEIPFFRKQRRLLLANNLRVDPASIDDYLAIGGYSALSKALQEKNPDDVIAEIKRSGLRGRGGAGFSTGNKWELCRKAKGDIKYVICNADEGDPGAYMDRSLLEGNPHSVIEGMIIGGYAMGACEGIIYVRDEYPLAVKHAQIAIHNAREYGLLGQDILGSGFNFDISVSMGAGAFVCGEETALIASIEGERGTPRQRPPFPAQKGLWGKPTNINNVETWANVPLIITEGAEWFSSIGTERSKGTKIFSLVGKINNTGLVEVPLGSTLREIIYDIGGGIPGNRRFKAVQTGGPSGGCIPAYLLDLQIDYEGLKKAGCIMGSGGMIVMDENTCMVDIARYYTAFLNDESCGKCLSCRKGTQRMEEILTDITQGRGREGDIELLEELASTIRDVSMCGLGQTAGNPVLATIRYFREEYEEHIRRHHCRAGTCKALVKSPCQNACPAGIDVPRYIRLINEGKPDEAVAVIREKVPFPAVLGHVCLHFCEQKCRRGEVDEALAIKMLKRYAADHDSGLWKKKVKRNPATGKRVAVIGSGPAGLTAAYYLARKGHGVTVFESASLAGGMLRLGIPEFRLPRKVLDREIEEIKAAGVDIIVNTETGSLDDLFKQGFSAIFAGIGAYRSRDMGIEGEDDASVLNGIDFLKNVNLGVKMNLGDRVLVVGGGNAAIDSARTALRMGVKEVSIAYRRTYAAMPASAEEVKEALEEGVKLDFLVTPVRISMISGRLRVEFVRMELGNIDESGRQQPVPIKGSEFSSEYDTIIKNIGDRPEVPDSFGLELGKGGEIRVDPDTLATSRQGVYAGGDVVSGPASVIEAIAAGRQAAISIDRYLGGNGDIGEKLAPPEVIRPFTIEEGERRRPPMCMLSPEKRRSFELVELGYDEAKAKEEAGRCLRCDLEGH